METTTLFKDLEPELQKKLVSLEGKATSEVLNTLATKLIKSGNRSNVYEIYKGKYILKQLIQKRDNDINAMLKLEGIEYFPKLYAYKYSDYLIMEKVKGVCLEKLIASKDITNEEILIIITKVEDATRLIVGNGHFDHDFKIEHLYWNKEKEELKLIDLGLYDEQTYFYPSQETEILDRVDYFKKQLKYRKVYS